MNKVENSTNLFYIEKENIALLVLLQRIIFKEEKND